jgi:hypothetical protein
MKSLSVLVIEKDMLDACLLVKKHLADRHLV